MNNFKELISNIVDDLSIEEGVIATEVDNFNNPLHIVKLKEILDRYNIPNDIAENLINNLLFEKDSDNDSISDEEEDKKKELAKRKGLEHQQYGIYTDKQGNRYKWNDAQSDFIKTSDADSKDDKKSPDKSGGAGETPPSKTKVTNIPKNQFDDTEGSEEVSIKKPKPKDMSPEELEVADHRTTNEQLNLTKEEAKAQAEKKGEKGVGAGTAESRAGEAAVHWAVRQLIKGRDIEDIKKELSSIAKDKDKVLDEKWAKAAINTAQWINEVYGNEIDKVVWDTPEGRALIGVEGHGTSSDMFIKLKDGTRVGISLKQTTNVFLLNGGYAKQHELLIDSIAQDLEVEEVEAFESATSIENYDRGLNAQLTNIRTKFESEEVKNLIRERVEYWQNNPESAAAKGAFDSSKYLKYLDWETTKSIIEKLPHVKKEDIKYIAKLCKDPEIRKQFPELYDNLRNEDTELTKTILDQAKNNPNVSDGLKDVCLKGMHIEDILFGSSEQLDEFITLYGNDPAVELDKGVILSIFDLQEEYEQFLSASDEAYDEIDGTVPPTDKEVAQEEFMSKVRDKLIIDMGDDGKSGVIKIKHAGPPKQVFSLFSIRTRSRPIGSSPTLEMDQTTFMGNVIKEGSVNVQSWKSSTKKRFVNARVKEIMEDYEDASTSQRDAMNQEIEELKSLL